MTVELAKSYEVCRLHSRKSGSNFLLSFWFLPREKRQAMYAIYAFFRHTDDLADAPTEDPDACLNTWRTDLQAALAGDFRDERFPALVDTVQKYQIDPSYLNEAIDGVQSDLHRKRFATFAELEHYCYQVASAIGLCCLPIWGVAKNFDQQAAISTGVAFQLTNILRDICEDAQRDRIYLPLEHLQQFELAEEDILAAVPTKSFAELMRYEVRLARDYFDQAQALRPALSPDGLKIFDAMNRTYRSLLDQIASDPLAVLRGRLRIGSWQKMKLLATLAVSQWQPKPTSLEQPAP